jgi:hypothetical protein
MGLEQYKVEKEGNSKIDLSQFKVEEETSFIDSIADGSVIANTIESARESWASYADNQMDIFSKAGSSISADMSKRGINLMETGRKGRSGEITHPEGLLDTLGDFSGGVIDIIGHTIVGAVKTIGNTIDLYVPDTLEDPIKDSIAQSWDWLINTTAGVEAQKALSKDIETYREWKSENQRSAKHVESIVNTAFLFAPVKFKVNASPVPTKIITDATKQKVKNRTDAVKNMLLPNKATKETVLRTEQAGFLNKSVIVETPLEKEVINQVKILPNIKPNSATHGYQHNLNIIQKENTKTRLILEKQLDNETVIIHPTRINNAVNDAVRSTMKGEILIESKATIKNVESQILKLVDDLMKKHPTTPRGILDLRRAFDKALEGASKNWGAVTGVKDKLKINVRDALNKILDDVIVGGSTKRSLKKQHLLFKAQDMLAPKAATQAETLLGRHWANITRVIKPKLDLNRLIAIVGGTSVFVASASFLPAITGAIGFGFASYWALRGAQSPSAKAMLGQLLRETDKAIVATRNTAMVKQLKADRITIKEMFDVPVEKEDK